MNSSKTKLPNEAHPKNEYCGNENPQKVISKYLFQPLNETLTKKYLLLPSHFSYHLFYDFLSPSSTFLKWSPNFKAFGYW